MTSHNSSYSQPSFAGPEFDKALQDLDRMSGQLESEVEWPGEQFDRLADSGVMGWVIPREYGGSELSSAELMLGYERLSASCLTTTFILTQRNGACQRLAGSENEDLKADLLPRLCRGEIFATVGISHLTTSRQHLSRPAVQVRLTDDGLVFNGTVPWVTGAKYADFILTGGTCDDGRQVLAVIPTAADGVRMKDPVKLLALNASQTGSVELDNVEIAQRYLVAGPVEQVMKQGKGGGAGSLTTSSLAVGTAEGALKRLRQEAEKRPDLEEIYEPLENERQALSRDIYQLSSGLAENENPSLTVESVRQRANSLVLRSTQAYLAACKGAGFMAGHPAERGVREAMFFLVWSCPQPVLTAALREFACVLEG